VVISIKKLLLTLPPCASKHWRCYLLRRLIDRFRNKNLINCMHESRQLLFRIFPNGLFMLFKWQFFALQYKYDASFILQTQRGSFMWFCLSKCVKFHVKIPRDFLEKWHKHLGTFCCATGQFCELCFGAVSYILYRAMDHTRSAVLLSLSTAFVYPSVTLRYRGHTSWVSSKVITQIISLGSNNGNLVQWEHPKFEWDRRGISLFSAENLQYLWNGAKQDRTKVNTDD